MVVKCKLTICFSSSWALNVDGITCNAISVHVSAIKAHHETAQWLEHPTGVQNLIGSIPVGYSVFFSF